MTKIILIILAILLAIFGFYTIHVKDEKRLGAISFVFSVVVFLVGLFPINNLPPALNNFDNELNLKYQTACSLLDNGKYQQAVEIFASIADRDFKDVKVLLDEASNAYYIEIENRISEYNKNDMFKESLTLIEYAKSLYLTDKLIILEQDTKSKYGLWVLDNAKVYAGKSDWDSAISVLDKYLNVAGSNFEIELAHKEYRSNKVINYVNSLESIEEQITYLTTVIDSIDTPEMIGLLNNLEKEYKAAILNDIAILSDYEEARKIIKEALVILPDDADLIDALAYYTPIYLDQIAPLLYETGDAFFTISSETDAEGNEQFHIIHPGSTGTYKTTAGLGAHDAQGIHRTYSLENEYRLLTGTIFLSRNYALYTEHILYLELKIYGDDNLLYEAPYIESGTKQKSFEINVDLTGIEELHIDFECKHKTNMFSWEDVVFGLAEASLFKA